MQKTYIFLFLLGISGSGFATPPEEKPKKVSRAVQTVHLPPRKTPLTKDTEKAFDKGLAFCALCSIILHSKL